MGPYSRWHLSRVPAVARQRGGPRPPSTLHGGALRHRWSVCCFSAAGEPRRLALHRFRCCRCHQVHREPVRHLRATHPPRLTPGRRFHSILRSTPLASGARLTHIQLSIVSSWSAALAPLAYCRVGERDQLRDRAHKRDARVRVPTRVHVAGEHVVCKTVVHRLPRRSCCHGFLVFLHGYSCNAFCLRWLTCIEVASIGGRGASTVEVGCLLRRPPRVRRAINHTRHHSRAVSRKCQGILRGAVPPHSHLRWDRNPQVPPLRHRSHHQPHPRLRCPHCDAGCSVCGQHRHTPRVSPRPHRSGVAARDRRLHPGRRRLVCSPKTAHPVLHRPPVLQKEVRREEDDGSGPRLLVAAPGSRSGEERRKQSTAWLEPYTDFHSVVRTYYRAEHWGGRCSDLRRPTRRRWNPRPPVALRCCARCGLAWTHQRAGLGAPLPDHPASRTSDSDPWEVRQTASSDSPSRGIGGCR